MIPAQCSFLECSNCPGSNMMEGMCRLYPENDSVKIHAEHRFLLSALEKSFNPTVLVCVAQRFPSEDMFPNVCKKCKGSFCRSIMFLVYISFFGNGIVVCLKRNSTPTYLFILVPGKCPCIEIGIQCCTMSSPMFSSLSPCSGSSIMP